jgi:hypothetical protein
MSETDAMIGGVFNPFAVLDPETDFGRALQVQSEFDLLSIGDGSGLVLTGAYRSVGKSSPNEGRVLLAWDREGVTDEEELLEAAEEARNRDSLVDTGRRWSIPDEELLLVDAIDAPDPQEHEQQRIPVTPGEYNIFHGQHPGNEEFGLPVNVMELRMRK